MPETLSAPAPAKINLVLEVLGKRADGYHDIATVLQTLELADTVTLTFGVEPGVTVTGPFAAGTPADESNLAWRAAAEVALRTGRPIDRLRITVDKHVPVAAGLGGGSSDAATVLRLLWQKWPETSSVAAGVAAATGSDVAAIANGGTMFAYGRGEIAIRQPELPAHGVVLFAPSATLDDKTSRMFAALDSLPYDDDSISRAMCVRLHHSPRLTTVDTYNAFERVAFDVFPGLASLWEDLETRIGEPIRLAGAGPTLFWIGPLEEAAGVAAKAEGLACAVISTRTSRSLWRP